MKTTRTLRRCLTPALLVALVAVPAALAGPGHGPHGHGFGHGFGADDQFEPERMGMMLRHMADRLELTEDQRAQMHELLQQQQATVDARRDIRRAAHDVLGDAMRSETFDEAAVRAAAQQVAALRVEAMVDRARLHSELMQILTPEQREEARELHEEMQERRAERRESREERRRGPRPDPRGF